MKRVRVIAGGRVQGVGFRFFVQEQARHYDVRGYVKNLPGGNVEIDAEGDSEMLDKFLEKCRKGPMGARVDNFYIQDVPAYGYTRFRIRHSDDL